MMDKSVKLNSGYSMPILGLGTFLSPEPECEFAVECAIKSGYRSIDTAAVYRNERAVGRAIKKCIDEGIVKREDLFITTKLWTTDWKAENAAKAIAQSLKNLQLDYIDLLLIHMAGFLNLPEEEEKRRQEGDFYDYDGRPPKDPRYRLGYNLDCLKEMWGAMEKAVREGKVRSIGISNFSTKKVNDLLSFCTIPPAVNQVELHPYLQQWETIEALDKHGIKLMGFFPLGGAYNMSNNGGGENTIIEYGVTNHNKAEIGLMKHPLIHEIAKNHNKSPAQVLIRWAIQRGTICIPKSVHENRIKENIDVFDFELTDDEMQKIRSLDLGKRYSDQTIMFYADDTDPKVHWDNEYI